MESPKSNADLIRPTPRQLRAIGEGYLYTPNSLVENTDISDRAKILLQRMLMRPKGWNFNQSYFAHKMGVSTRVIGSWMRELRDAGYLATRRRSVGGGRWEYWYTISTLPWAEAIKAEKEQAHDPEPIREFRLEKAVSGE